MVMWILSKIRHELCNKGREEIWCQTEDNFETIIVESRNAKKLY